jgi:hypothetical protein
MPSSSQLDRAQSGTSTLSDGVRVAVRAWFADEDGPVVPEDLLRWLDETGDLHPSCGEAIAGYVCALACVEQEVLQPDGRVTRSGPLKPHLSRTDFAHPRFPYTVASWYDDLGGKLPGVDDDWDAWPPRGFRCVLRRDEATDAVICWTVRDVWRTPRSTWSVQVESGAAHALHTTFAVPNGLLAGTGHRLRPGTPDPCDTLSRAFLAFRQRLGRVLALLEHLHHVGVGSTEEYRQWCQAQGFSPDLGKSVRKRRGELEAAAGETDGADPETWFAQVVSRLHTHTDRPGDLRTWYLQLLGRTFGAGLAGGARDAFRDLLLHCQQHASLTGTQPVIAQRGRRAGNTYVEALGELARHYRRWLRPLADWRPSGQDPRLQFASLARHLLSRYELPLFMDGAWFRGRSALAQRQQAWFLHMADGHNIRTAQLPLALTKRMAHCFGEAPAHFSIEMALRRAQVVGQFVVGQCVVGGAGDELVDAILSTPLGTSFDNEEFWATVVTWWVKHPELDPELVAPVYDFLQYRRFSPREVAEPGGEVRIEPPPEPNLSMKSRSVPKLLEAIDAWHIQLSREARVAGGGWPKSSIPDFQYDEASPKTKRVRRWKITELRTDKEIFTEGRELRHCVSSYASQCRSGRQSIWSLQVSDATHKNRRLVTIAVDPRARAITQVRGRLNLTAKSICHGKGGKDDAYAT